MQRTFETVEASEPLDTAFIRLQQEPDRTLLVTDRKRLIGLVGLDDITSLLRIKRAAAGRSRQAPRAELGTGPRTGMDR
jgi:CBS-domain-containing membrane protein